MAIPHMQFYFPKRDLQIGSPIFLFSCMFVSITKSEQYENRDSPDPKDHEAIDQLARVVELAPDSQLAKRNLRAAERLRARRLEAGP